MEEIVPILCWTGVWLVSYIFFLLTLRCQFGPRRANFTLIMAAGGYFLCALNFVGLDLVKKSVQKWF
mgnify:CR=1 FL=1